jgi:ABC-type polysaccharide/polyol phosphate export permease
MSRRHARDVVITLVERDLKVRYRHSLLGIVWSQLGPLALLGMVSLVFTKVVPLHIANYPLFVLIGLLAWTWFATGLDAATHSIAHGGELVQRPGVAPTLLPTVAVLTQMMNFLIAMPVVLLAEWAVLGRLPGTLVAFPVVVVAELAVLLPPAWLLAAINVRWRDVGHGVTILLMPLLYATPVLYPSARVPGRWRTIFDLNPLSPVLDGYRDVVLFGRWPAWTGLLAVTAGGVVVGLACHQFARLRAHTFAEEL